MCSSDLLRGCICGILLLVICAGSAAQGQRTLQTGDETLGGYGPFRANNDLLYYHLHVRVDPQKQFLRGTNTIRFQMLTNGRRIQLDLVRTFQIDSISLLQQSGRSTPLRFQRAVGRTVYIDFPNLLRRGREYSIDFRYSGHPAEMGRFGGFVFRKDPAGRPLVNTACEEEGASVWWPNKDQWRDEVRSMDISVEAPTGMQEVSNGRFQRKTDLHDGYTRWDWAVSYPINNYDVSLNIGTYTHFGDKWKNLSLDYFVFPEDLDKAKRQFTQVKDMLKAYERFFGPYPFPRDGYKLVEALYSGVENQTAITYGNHFQNGYLGRPKTGYGSQFDFIIVHESAHEWFGNSITARDRSDMWIHEGWANYCESLFVEDRWGKEAGLLYTNTGKENVKNERPIIDQEGTYATPPVDQYKKGGLFLNTLRNVVDDDAKWFALLHAYSEHFRYQTIMTTDMVTFFNDEIGQDLTPIFNQYLRHASLPVLELRFDDARHTVSYRWRADEPGFAMPIKVGLEASWQTVRPTTAEWQSMPTLLTRDRFKVATDLFYVKVHVL